MDLSLHPVTEPGRRFVALCEEHAVDFATRATEHDRASSFPFENVQAMQESGALAAPVPAELGGLGLVSLHDLAAGVNRLARGDSSTAIAVNMHLAVAWTVARAWREATATGADNVDAYALPLGLVGQGQLVAAVLATEAGTAAGYVRTEVTKVDGGYQLDGRKSFATLSPAAYLLLVMARLRDGDDDLVVYAPVAPDATGVTLCDNWDALGMRASGSQDVIFEGCFVPDGSLFIQGPWGALNATTLTGQLAGVMGLVGAFLGIAEVAQQHAVNLVTTRRKAPGDRLLAERPAIQFAIAENEIDLAASRAILERAAILVDGYYEEATSDDITMDVLHGLYANFQAAKQFVNHAAVRIVDRALTVSGGAGYSTSNPLSRLYRDVRAGPFMQLYSPNEAFEYIGKVTLGLDPTLDL